MMCSSIKRDVIVRSELTFTCYALIREPVSQNKTQLSKIYLNKYDWELQQQAKKKTANYFEVCPNRGGIRNCQSATFKKKSNN